MASAPDPERGAEFAGAVPPHPATLGPARLRRRKIVDVEALARAVLAVGFRHLTVEGVAAQLQTTHSAIYHHVRDRRALIGLATDHLIRRTRWPQPSGDWRDTLVGSGTVIHRLLVQHPGLALELTVHAMPSEAYREHARRLWRHLETLGFDEQSAFLAVDLVLDLAIDAAMRTEHQDAIYERRPGALDDWFARKLEVVIEGIGASLAPRSAPS